MLKELILGYISLVYSIIAHVLCYQKCTGREFNQNKLKSIIVILIFTFINFLCSLYGNIYIKTYISMLMFFLIYKIIYKADTKEIIITTIILTTMSIILEFLLMGVMTTIIPNMNKLNDNLIYKTISTFIHSTIFYLIIAIPKINSVIKKIINKLKEKIKIEIVLLAIIVIINIMTVLYGDNYKDYKIFFIIGISIISLISLLLLLICIMLSKEKVNIQNKILRENIEEYEKIADDYSELKHNLTNDLLAIKSIANKKAQDLVDEKIKKYHKNYNWVNKLSNIPKGLQGLVYIKLNSITKYKINFEVKSNLKENLIEKIKSKTYANLCDILGIILDNAVEATRKSKDKSIFINMEESNQEVKIQIINTFKDELDLDKIGKSKYSTKGLKRGIGLNYINKISNKSIKVKKEIINNLFVVNISFDI